MLSSKYRVYVYGGIALLLGITILIIIALTGQKNGDVNLPSELNKISETDHAKGNPEAKVILIEYSDFQCPACAAFASLIEDMMAEFGQHVYFAYRHFPLVGHMNSQPAVRASEAAAKQGKFWEMHNLLFANQALWGQEPDPQNIFLEFAKTLGLNEEQFLADYGSAELVNLAKDAYDNGLKLNLSHTPTLILNGQVIINPRTKNDFRTLIREAIDKAESAETAETPTPAPTPATSLPPTPVSAP